MEHSESVLEKFWPTVGDLMSIEIAWNQMEWRNLRHSQFPRNVFIKRSSSKCSCPDSRRVLLAIEDVEFLLAFYNCASTYLRNLSITNATFYLLYRLNKPPLPSTSSSFPKNLETWKPQVERIFSYTFFTPAGHPSSGNFLAVLWA